MMLRRILIPTALAVVLFFLILKLWPDQTAKWHQEEGYRWISLAVEASKPPGFTKVAADQSGITFLNTLSEIQIIENRHLLNGSGVALGDIDADGLTDVYFCRLDGPNALYKNKGAWMFEDITGPANVACEKQFSTGAAFADIDGDGDLDLLVTALGGPNACLLNDGSGKFTDVSEASGITDSTGATSLALGDIDADGDLDLYIANYKKRTIRDMVASHERTIDKTVRKVGDAYEVLPEFQEHYSIQVNDRMLERFEYAEPDMLFLNDGTGRFAKVDFADRFTDANGNPAPGYTDWGLSVRMQDIDGDGDTDIYVCNDFESPDRIWINDGTGHFQALPKLAIRSASASSMGVDFADIDRDSHLDFFLTEMLSRNYTRRKVQQGPTTPDLPVIGVVDDRPQYMRNMLFLNRGDGTFAEIGQFAAVDASEWSWTPLFLDVDLDGYEDLLIVTGHYYDAMDADVRFKLKTMPETAYSELKSEVFAYPPLETQNFAFKNNGDLTFQDVSHTWSFDDVDVSHGMAMGDLDNDGDLDVAVNRLGQPALVYRNEAGAPRLAVRLVGSHVNTRAIGARVRVEGGGLIQSKEVIAGGSYLSHSDHLLSFAAFSPDRKLRINVAWKDGNKTVIDGARGNRLYEISELNADSMTVTSSPDMEKPLFEDLSQLLAHRHHEESYNDFQRQALLPRSLSQLGPGVAWFDYDGDNDDDLFIGSGKGGFLAGFLNDGKGRFSARELGDQALEHTSILGWARSDGSRVILVGNSNYESEPGQLSTVGGYRVYGGTIRKLDTFDVTSSAIGPAAMADYDGDGDLDLFVGGRVKPGSYPSNPESVLLRNENGRFTRDGNSETALADLGMVSAALFSDIDSDKDPDLILAIEWGPVTVLRNINSRFENATQELGLAPFTGWWNGIATGDLNEDGRPDIVATNWGLNTRYQASMKNPRFLFYHDFDNNGTQDIIEATFDSTMQKLVPEQSYAALTKAIPYVGYRAQNHHEFASMGLEDIFGFRLTQSDKLQATTLQHIVLLSEDSGFRARTLPVKAQWAPAFGVNIADCDGDGHEDVFISQNFFAYQPEAHRSDAGRALWMKGDGRGNLTTIPGQRSGVMVYGEQRASALADYDRDGRIDLVVSQNGAETKLYHNTGAKPGLRVQLIGPPGNPQAIGASIRLKYGATYGPLREVQAGSGYWSQNSATQVLGMKEQPDAIWVRWPDGQVTETPVKVKSGDVRIVWTASSQMKNAK